MTSVWEREPELTQESDFTPDAEPQWLAWNGMSPELQFCEMARRIVVVLRPAIVVETGVGQGFMTRRLLGGHRDVRLFESDPSWRQRINDESHLEPLDTPAAEDFAEADFIVLDSDPPHRHRELAMFLEFAKPGTFLLLHDCTTRHGPHAPHYLLMEQAASAVRFGLMQGQFTQNPRGGFLGVRV